MASVFVRGFDFGTSEEDIRSHCESVGEVKDVEMWGKKAAVVKFASAAAAKQAVKTLDKSTIGDNARYIDVKLNDESKGGDGGAKKRSAPAKPGARVFVRGFDRDTTDDQFDGHMSQAGEIVDVKWISKGSAVVTYSSAEVAQEAVDTLQGTTIEGNSRYIDVLMKDDEERGAPPAKKFKAAGGKAAGGKGASGKSFDKAVTSMATKMASKMASEMVAKMMGSKKGGGKAAKQALPYKKPRGDHSDEDPAGSGRVFVRGFDFGTEDASFLSHMKKAGPIHTVHWVSKGSAVVVYKTMAGAKKAVQTLNGTTLKGNSRYMDVILRSK